MDQEALSMVGDALPDENLQSAPAGEATKASEPAPSQEATPAPADPAAASAPAQDPSAGNEPQDPAAQPQEAPKKGVQKRIDELTRERYEAQRQADYWRQQAQAQAAKPAEPEKPAPRIEDFQDINQFLQARDEWVADKVKADIRRDNEQAAQRQQSERQQHTQAIAQQQQVERFLANEADAQTRYADYAQAVQTPLMQQFKQVRPDVAQAVIDSPHGADIVYFLAKNPAQVQSIAQLNPIAAAREIGRIEQMFMQPRAQSTSAPPPPRTVGNNAQVERKPEQMSMREYRAWRSKQ